MSTPSHMKNRHRSVTDYRMKPRFSFVMFFLTEFFKIRHWNETNTRSFPHSTWISFENAGLKFFL